jgi:hypothetical protein
MKGRQASLKSLLKRNSNDSRVNYNYQNDDDVDVSKASASELLAALGISPNSRRSQNGLVGGGGGGGGFTRMNSSSKLPGKDIEMSVSNS